MSARDVAGLPRGAADRWKVRRKGDRIGAPGQHGRLPPFGCAAFVGLALFLSGCAESGEALLLPAVDPTVFEATVYPVLLSDCGFPACHGNPDRFFAVYGPGRRRLSSSTLPYDPATPEELALTFTRARSMLVDPEGPAKAPLLRKPLAVKAGGAGHGGDDPWGEPIFQTKQDPRYKALFFWATATTGAGEEP